MSDRLLAELAGAAGICLDWIDAHGQPQQVSPDAQRSLLEALGHAAQSPAQVRASLDELTQQRNVLHPGTLLIQEIGQPLRLPEQAAQTRYRLQGEDGDLHEGRLGEGGELPCPAQAGYYQLEIADRLQRVAITPSACPSVEQLCGRDRVWGLTAQLYALRRSGDGGLGDTRAVAALAMHAANQGADALALSPVHALFSADAQHYSPYSPSSRLFFNVLHAAPSSVLGRDAVDRAIQACGLRDELNRLEALELIDWPAATLARQRLLARLHEDFRQAPDELHQRFQRFCDARGDALVQHCRFEAIHEHQARSGGPTDWRQWPAHWRDPAQAAVSRFAAEHAERVGYHAFAQWLIAEGLEAAQASACGAGMKIGLIADMAVGSDCTGSQAWSRQDELLAEATIGAPPDILNRRGQNWGVSAFSPGGLRQHGFRAFIEMLQANLAHAGGIRIDHVMGLQRLWLIPKGAEPQDGAYLNYPRDDLLRLLALEAQRHRALVIGEDLGTVPAGLREELARRNVLGTRVLLFEQEHGRFLAPREWPRNALATTTTHDLPSMGGWFAGHDLDWRVRAGHAAPESLEDDHAARAHERTALLAALASAGQLHGEAPDSETCLQACIGFIGSTPSCLALLPLEDACGLDQQPNLPGPGSDHPNWRRRYPQPVHQLLEQHLPRQRLARLAATRGRRAMTELRATLRLQLHRDFTLDDACALVPYMQRLGVSHLYASPVLTARPGSMHGYDVIDPGRINPELGGEAALLRLVAALREHGMGLIVDVVSNHMAVGGDANPWWLDVLEWGRSSRYAAFFDIQWQSHDPLLTGQLLVPFLRSDYGQVLADGSLTLHFDAQRGTFHAQHFEHRLPITPPSYGEILLGCDAPPFQQLGQQFRRLAPAARDEALALCAQLARQAALQPHAVEHALLCFSPDSEQGQQRLHRLLEQQHYRVASWRTAADDINWRRFFDINELGGLRVERPEVFEQTHAKLFELIERGLIDGLRIDHIDGLADPHGYCRRLRRRIKRLRGGEFFPVYVEKILGHDEHLPHDWAVDGTTGYDFMNQVSLLQHDPAGEAPLRELWMQASGRPGEFASEVIEARRLVLASTLAGDLEEVAQRLLQVARNDIATRDLTLGSIRRALLELIVHFPVYRTYAQACGRSAQDRQFFQQALDGARQTLAEADQPLLDYLDQWLGGAPLRRLPPGRARTLRAQVLTRFQQLTSPVAAKAVEDTALYRTGVLLSRYDVGFDPEHFSCPVAQFHQRCLQRAEHHPDALLATATHDHKRGEDSRARLAVLSERARWYVAQVRQWQELAVPLCADLPSPAPDHGEELILYQALLASWPLELQADDADGLRLYLQRLHGWQRKALREAKLNSSWSAPNEAHESACAAFLEKLLCAAEGRALRQALHAAVRSIAPAGALNGLVQCLLRMTTPGVPDLYQGCDDWDFSLVDPDNRRPVDYPRRLRDLERVTSPADLLEHWQDGRIKQWLISRVLGARRERPQLFSRGDYRPLQVEGEHAGAVIAFIRSLGSQHALIVAPRLVSERLGEATRPHVAPARWGDTRILIPPELSAGTWTSVLAPIVSGTGDSLPLASLLTDFPVNLLLQDSRHEHR